jgi:hypothetical protein
MVHSYVQIPSQIVSWRKLFIKMTRALTRNRVRWAPETQRVVGSLPEYGVEGGFASDPVKRSSMSKRIFRIATETLINGNL